MSKLTTIEVTFPVELTRNGWQQTGFGEVFGEHETEHDIRAAVTFYGINDAPEVELLDKARVEDLGLTAAELEGAEEQAIEAACDVLRKRPTADDLADEAADRAYDDERDWQMLAGAAS